MSPTADEVLSYFKTAHENGIRLGRKETLSNNFTEALSDGLSCLAALPTEVSHLIPEPYRGLSENGVVESIYATCMDKNTNVFDIELFQQMCEEHLKIEDTLVPESQNEFNKFDRNRRKGRKIRTGKTFWTVLRRVSKPLVHPYQPPPSFSDRLSSLRYDSKIKAFHMHSTDRPRWLRENGQESKKYERSKFTNIQGVLPDARNLDSIKFLKVYQKEGDDKDIELNKRKKAKAKKVAPRLSKSKTPRKTEDQNGNHYVDKNVVHVIDESARMVEYNHVPPPDTPKKTLEGLYPLQCIQELSAAGSILSIEWNKTTPSFSDYAAISPDLYELYQLRIKGHTFEFTLQQDRNKKSGSNQAMKHHLASVALERIFVDCDWSMMTMNEMKSYLGSTRSNQLKQVTNVESRNALQCLNELRDSKIFDIQWNFYAHSSVTELVHLNLHLNLQVSSSQSLSWNEYRDIYSTSKATSKQSLAETALIEIFGEENDWRQITLKDMRRFIQNNLSYSQNEVNCESE